MFIPLYDNNPLVHVNRPYVNYALIAVNVVVYALTGGFGEEFLQHAAFSLGLVPSVVNDFKELPPEYILIPENASYVSYAFLHSDLLHLGGNMLFLWVFGDNIEDAAGHVKYLVFYLLCAAGAGFAHTLVDPYSDVPLIGASGAIAGIVGAYLMLHPRVRVWVLILGRIPVPISAAIILGLWIAYQVYNFVNSYFVVSHVSWSAHIGGFLIGALLITVFRRRGVPLFDRGLAVANAEPPGQDIRQ
ncbi:MAG TPA: rhomboid family intramembrane serine protease [Afifellaceae bacterium]|nr:rhomboid family intramembrane serine protease [Afifellaceae bacterium]